MKRRSTFRKPIWTAGAMLALAMAAPARAQLPVTGRAVPPSPASQVSQQRFQVRIMEGVLETAVQNGAQKVSAQMRLVSPDIALFSGPARARGFRLDGYGVFFALDVPALHRSVSWSVRTLSQSNADIARAIQAMRRMVQNQGDPRMKTELEQALRLVELQVGPVSRPPVRTVVTPAANMPGNSSGDLPMPNEAPAAEAVADPEAAAVMENPSSAYTDAVQRAIVDAMLDYGTTLSLTGEEWLTVAARENSDSILAGDLSDSVTVTLRARAADLDAFKSGRLTRDEMRQRVEVREF